MSLEKRGTESLRASAFFMTMEILSKNSGKIKTHIDKKFGRKSPAISDVWTPGQSIPADLVPYLKRIQTSDIMEYLDREDHGHHKYHAHDGIWAVKKFARRILKFHGFDSIMGLVILLNLVVMIIETDLSAQQDDWGNSIHWTEVVGFLVLALFVIELCVRLIAFGCLFWLDSWNIFDFLIVIVDCVFSVIAFIAGGTFPVSVLRVFRLAKLARIFKVLRVFPELRLLLAGLFSSISAILWGTLLLFFCMLVWALVAVLFIHPLNQSIDYGDCERCSRAYSSVMQSTLTFWQSIVTGDSWGLVTIPVIEKYPGAGVFFVAVYLSVGMAVTNLILGVVVNVAQQAQDALSEADNTDKALEKLARHTHLLQLCKAMDTDGDGMLSHDEVFTAFDNAGEFQETISSLDITREDFDIVWSIIDSDKKGYASYKELVSFISSMKTTDTVFMLSYIKYYITIVKEVLVEKMDEAVSIGHRLEADMHEIEEHEEQILRDERFLQDQQSELLKNSIHSCEMIESLATQCDVQEQTENAQGSHMENAISQGKIGLLSYKQGSSSTALQDSSVKPSKQTSGYIKLPRKDDPMITAFNDLRNDVLMLQAELKGILKDMERKFDQQVSNSSTMDLNMVSSSARSDLLVVPARRSSSKFTPICCKAPARYAV